MEWVLIVLCVCSVSSYKIFPLVDQSALSDIEIAAESAIAETVVYTNLPTTGSPDEVVNSTTPIILSKSETSTSEALVPPTSSVPVILEAKTLSEPVIESTTNSKKASDSLNQTKTADLETSSLVTTNTLEITTLPPSSTILEAVPAILKATTLSGPVIESTTNSKKASDSLSQTKTTDLETSLITTNIFEITTLPPSSTILEAVPAILEAKTLSGPVIKSSANPKKASDSVSQTKTVDLETSSLITTNISEITSLPPSSFPSTSKTSTASTLTTAASSSSQSYKEVEENQSLLTSAKASTILNEPVPTSTIPPLKSTSDSTTSAGFTLSNSKEFEMNLSSSSLPETSVSENESMNKSITLSDSGVAGASLSKFSSSTSSLSLTTTSSVETTSVSSIDSETDSYIFETTTEDLSFLSLDLLPPKTEYRKNEPDPRYDY